jgi:hypothetical protein
MNEALVPTTFVNRVKGRDPSVSASASLRGLLGSSPARLGTSGQYQWGFYFTVFKTGMSTF